MKINPSIRRLSLSQGLLIRLAGGEKLVRLPPLVYFPGYEGPTEEEVSKWTKILCMHFNDNIENTEMFIYLKEEKK